MLVSVENCCLHRLCIDAIVVRHSEVDRHHFRITLGDFQEIVSLAFSELIKIDILGLELRQLVKSRAGEADHCIAH